MDQQGDRAKPQAGPSSETPGSDAYEAVGDIGKPRRVPAGQGESKTSRMNPEGPNPGAPSPNGVKR